MGQFDRFIERNAKPSSRGMRVFCLVMPIAMIVQAVGSHRLDDILTAAFGVVLFLPAGIAPKAHRARLAALERHLVLSAVCMFLLMLCALFVLLAKFLSHPTSLYIAVPTAFVLTATGVVRQHARTRQ
ncbi:hypothetical protein [Kribbella sp. NPDC004875]|uniref:hypothetical protein n=1 Tax=Kribbella sp. NPDC004875 TaxID=3364107 RepID=UPI00369967E0